MSWNQLLAFPNECLMIIPYVYSQFIYFNDIDYLPSLSDNDAITISPLHSPVEKKKLFSFPSASSAAGNPPSSQPMSGTSYINQNTSSPFKYSAFDSSQSISSSISSSQISGNMANVTCGNCHQKGHNRKWPQCPNYHSYEETQRRQVCL